MQNSHPTFADLHRLTQEKALGLTAYVHSDPANDDYTRTAVKSALDTALKELREIEPELRHNDIEAFHTQIDAVVHSPDLTHPLSTLAVFVTADRSEVHAVHNQLPELTRAGQGFAVGPLLRALTVPQDAFVLTLASDEWALWHATAQSSASEMDTHPDAPDDVADATNRATVRGRSHIKRLVGDEGQKHLLERFAAIVLESIHPAMDSADPRMVTPLFIFATEPLLSMAVNAEHRRPIIPVHGASNELNATEIEASLRPLLAIHNVEVAREQVAAIADWLGSETAVTDLNQIAEAAVAGAVETLFFNFEAEVPGSLNLETGALTVTDTGDDALTQLALVTLSHGGTVRAIRSEEVPLPQGSEALARLRFTV